MGAFQDNFGTVKGTATEIVEIFDAVLEQHGISIPDEDRTGSADEAAIYGMVYGDLVDEISEVLSQYIGE